MRIRYAMTFAVLLLGLLGAGCNAVKGLGQDLQDGAEAVQSAIDPETSQSNRW